MKPDVRVSYEFEYHDPPMAESNVVDKTQAMGFIKEPSVQLESNEAGLEEKYKVNNLDDLDKPPRDNVAETKKIEPSIKKPAESQVSVQKSTVVSRQGVGKSESTISFSSLPKASYSIQVGAFLHKDNAIKMVVILRREGYSANIVNFNDAKGRVWYTVRIGEYASLRVANKHAKDFSSKQKLDSIVRPIGRF